MNNNGNSENEKFNIEFLFHNLIIHPVAGVLWFFGADYFATKLHQWNSLSISEREE